MTTTTKPHQWRPIEHLPAGQITASCSRKGEKICSRCSSIQCVLGRECYDCNRLMIQDCKPKPAKKGRPLEPADINFPRRIASRRVAREREAQERSRIKCPKCGQLIPQAMAFCGYCGTPLPVRQLDLIGLSDDDDPTDPGC